MNFAIIAAGEGSRLAKEGITTPKPLIPVQGTPLIERLVEIFSRHGAGSISIIINSQQPQTRDFLEKLRERYPINIVVKDTPSSMHSLHALAPHLRGDKFCLTTVDTIFKEHEFSQYIKDFEECRQGGVMAVTEFVDDEKPLYVATDSDMNITGFHNTATVDCRHVSGGIYGLCPEALDILDECMSMGIERMRNFQRMLVERGMRLKAFPFNKIIDIDHAGDIEKAEKFINQE